MKTASLLLAVLLLACHGSSRAQNAQITLSMPQIWAQYDDGAYGSGHIQVYDADGEPASGVVLLQSENPQALELTVAQVSLSPEGQGTFGMRTHTDQVTNCEDVEVTATFGTSTAALSMLVCAGGGGFISDGAGGSGVFQPAPEPSLQSFTLSPTTVVGGATVTGSVQVDHVTAQTGPAAFSLASDPPGFAFAPASLSVPTTMPVAFSAETPLVATETIAIVAVEGEAGGRKARLRLLPIGFEGFTLEPTKVSAGQGTIGRLRLSAPAPKALTVALSADPPGVLQLPASVTIAEGAREHTFKALTSRRLARPVRVTVTAVLPLSNGQSATTTAVLGVE